MLFLEPGLCIYSALCITALENTDFSSQEQQNESTYVI